MNSPSTMTTYPCPTARPASPLPPLGPPVPRSPGPLFATRLFAGIRGHLHPTSFSAAPLRQPTGLFQEGEGLDAGQGRLLRLELGDDLLGGAELAQEPLAAAVQQGLKLGDARI